MPKKKSKIKKYVILLIVVLVLVAGYLYISSNAKKALKDIAKSYVVENTVQTGNVEIKITGNGVIEPNKRYEVYSNYGGEVKNCYYEEGEYVKKDKNLFRIGSSYVTAPATGTLITRNVEEGDYITTSMNATTAKPIAVLADISIMKVTMEVDELDIAKIQLGMQANIACDAVNGETFVGKVTKIASEGKSQNGVTTYDVTIQIEEPKSLKIGMNVDITLTVENKENVLKIPMDAINKNGKETYVYVKDETASPAEEKTSFTAPTSMEDVSGYKKQTVQTGINNKDEIEIISGLQQGEKVYSIGSSKSLTEYMMEQSTSHAMTGTN